MPDEETHRFQANPEGKGIQLNFNGDHNNPEHTERMSELFKEVGESNPNSIADFLIRLNEIDKIRPDNLTIKNPE